MSKIFRPIILSKNVITYLDDVFMQSQTKRERLKALEKYHQTLLKENMKPAPDKTHFFLPVLNSLDILSKEIRSLH